LRKEHNCGYVQGMPIQTRETPLRDIRNDLRARLRDAVGRRDKHRKLADRCDAEVGMLTALLDEEERRFGSSPDEPAHTKSRIPDLIVEGLATGRMNKEGLQKYVETQGIKPDGRSIHASVVNLMRAGKIKRVLGGYFALS
jgi:hypothetical protein